MDWQSGILDKNKKWIKRLNNNGNPDVANQYLLGEKYIHKRLKSAKTNEDLNKVISMIERDNDGEYFYINAANNR